MSRRWTSSSSACPARSVASNRCAGYSRRPDLPSAIATTDTGVRGQCADKGSHQLPPHPGCHHATKSPQAPSSSPRSPRGFLAGPPLGTRWWSPGLMIKERSRRVMWGSMASLRATARSNPRSAGPADGRHQGPSLPDRTRQVLRPRRPRPLRRRALRPGESSIHEHTPDDTLVPDRSEQAAHPSPQ